MLLSWSYLSRVFRRLQILHIDLSFPLRRFLMHHPLCLPSFVLTPYQLKVSLSRQNELNVSEANAEAAAMFLSTVYFASFSAALVLGYLVYKAALPKPIPGIPYNEYAAGRITGDLPEAIRYEAERSEMTGFLSQQLIKLNEPVIQLFLRPFGKPWIVVADFKEAQDVMVRRSREFDRSQFFSDIFKATLPTHHAGLRLGNEWKAHRRLVGDTMSPQFLDQVLSKRVYESINMLHKLWNEKSRLALGRPFTAKNDILNASL